MSGTQLLSDVGTTSTRLIGHPQFARKFAVCRSSLATLTRLAIGLVIMALLVIGLTNPSGAQMNRGARTESTPSSPEQHDSNAALFGRCLQDWDTETHMTRKEWSGACRRLLIERGDYLPKQRQ
jgi:hypothetical protein